MIVIEGKRGKSRKLEEILQALPTDKNNYIYVFDNVGVTLSAERIIHYQNITKAYNILLDWSRVSLGKYIDNGYIVFEYNIPIEMKYEFIKMAKVWDNEPYIKNVIITVQNNELEDIKVYEF